MSSIFIQAVLQAIIFFYLTLHRDVSTGLGGVLQTFYSIKPPRRVLALV